MTRMVPDTEALRDQPRHPGQRPQLCAVPMRLWPLQQSLLQLPEFGIRKAPGTARHRTRAQRLKPALQPPSMPLAGCGPGHPQLSDHITLPATLLEHLCRLEPKLFLPSTTKGQRTLACHASTNTALAISFP